MDEKPVDAQPVEPVEPSPSPDRVIRVRNRLEEFLDWLESAGLGSGWAERIVYWWKHFGIVKMLGVFLAVAIPATKYVWIPAIASGTVRTIAEGYGVEVDVNDWSGELFDLRATASGITIKARGGYARDEIFRSDSVTLDLSFWRRITKGQWIDEVTFDGPTLYAERLLSGRWNVEDAIDRSSLAPERPQTMAAGVSGYRVDAESRPADESWRISVPLLRMKDLRIQWVENLPGRSGGGLIQSTKATLFIDDVQVLARNYYRPATSGQGPVEFSIDGRTADGRISVNGLANPYRTDLRTGDILLAGTRKRPVPPILATSIYLENVGVAALSALTHQASLVPSTGTVTGRVDIVVYDDLVDCAADVVLANVKWSADRDSPSVRSRIGPLRAALEGLKADGRVRTRCGGNPESENYRPLYAIQAAVTSKALEEAPPVVRAYARVDEKRLSGQAPAMSPAQVKNEISAELRRAGVKALRERIGDDAANLIGGSFQRDLLQSQPDTGNPMSRGWKRLRSGWKKFTS